MHIVCVAPSLYLHSMWTISWNFVIKYEKGSGERFHEGLVQGKKICQVHQIELCQVLLKVGEGWSKSRLTNGFGCRLPCLAWLASVTLC